MIVLWCAFLNIVICKRYKFLNREIWNREKLLSALPSCVSTSMKIQYQQDLIVGEKVRRLPRHQAMVVGRQVLNVHNA